MTYIIHKSISSITIVAEGIEVPLEDAPIPGPLVEHKVSKVDLYFVRFSLLINGALTGLASLASSGWQTYLIGNSN